MRLLRIIFLVLLTVITTGEVSAQIEQTSKNSSGSFYSLFGLGYPTDNNTPRELGMGINGVSLDNTQSNTLQNPALWGKNAFTTASSGFHLNQFRTKGNNENSINALFGAGYLQLTFPVYREKFGISASLYSVTRSNYRFFDIDSLTVSGDESVIYATDLRGAGGINKMELGFGWNLNDNIALGYAPSYAFVSQDNSEDVFFDRSSFKNSNLNTKVTGGAMSHRFGALISLNEVLSSSDRVSIGSTLILPLNIDVKEETTVFKQVSGQEREVTLSDIERNTVKVPTELKAGATYYPNNLLNFSLEGLFQQWSKFEYGLNSSDTFVEMSDRYKTGFGGEYHPYRTNSDKFFSNFRYSAGVAYDSGHLTIQNQPIETLWFSAGLGIISPRSRSTVDLSVQYGIRGTNKNNLIKEHIWTFNLSVNLSELMFFRQKLN